MFSASVVTQSQQDFIHHIPLPHCETELTEEEQKEKVEEDMEGEGVREEKGMLQRADN